MEVPSQVRARGVWLVKIVCDVPWGVAFIGDAMSLAASTLGGGVAI